MCIRDRLKGSAGEENQSGTCVVSVALGDNQASFLGSVGPEERLLLNVGTGSQISAYTDRLIETGEADCRTYLGDVSYKHLDVYKRQVLLARSRFRSVWRRGYGLQKF